jgi:hypothetical protein
VSDKFLSIPDQMMGTAILPQEAVDWLAFGPPEQGARTSLSLDDQIRRAHTAAGTLLMAMWGSDLPAYVRSPSLATWYQIPAIYWGRQTPESMKSAMKRPALPDRLPGQPRAPEPRYKIDLPIYPHRLPASDLVGQPIAFREADVRRYFLTAGPVSTSRSKQAKNDPSASRNPVQRWSADEMTQEIKEWKEATSSGDRDHAWSKHFKARAAEHGWDNRSFRDHWSTAVGSVGRPGRPKPAQ